MTDEPTSVFLREIAQHPAALNDLAGFYRGEGRRLLLAWAAEARSAGRVLFAGMGTSEFAPELVLRALAEHGVDATTADAGEWLHYPRPFPHLVVLVSQSGESYETARLQASIPAGHSVVAIVNDEGSTLARRATLVLPMRAGAESAISTKTYVNTLAVLHLMACALAGVEDIEGGLEDLARVGAGSATVDRQAVSRAADVVADARAIHFVARGPAMAAAKQAALTFMEGTRTPCSSLTGGAFRHGPFELVDDAHRAVVFIPTGATHAQLRDMAAEMAAKGSRLVAITDGDVDLPRDSCQVLQVPAVGEALFPLAAAPTQEFLLYEVARRRGVEAGKFRHGGKVTTRE